MREQVKAIFVWYPKERRDLKAIHEENDVLTDDELVVVRGLVKTSKYACLHIRNEFPCGFKLLNQLYEVIILSEPNKTQLTLLSYPKK